MERELVKIVSNNPAHPWGYYIQFKDCVKPGDVEYFEPQIGAGDPSLKSIKSTKKKVK